MTIRFRKLTENAITPKRATVGDSGADLTATGMSFDEFGNVVYSTGIAVEIPKGWEGQLRPRSSISRYCLALSNSPSTIDSGYRGELIVKFKPTSHFDGRDQRLPDMYEVGDRICQLVINKVELTDYQEATELSTSQRGEGGFGSTGIK